MRTAVLVLLGALVVLILGLSAPGVRAAPPTLAILSPSNNAIIGNGTPVAVIFAVSNFNLTDPGTGGAPNPNEGHVEVSVDGALHETTSEETIVLALASGTHAIGLRLVADNGTGLNPEVTAAVTVTMTHGPAVGTPTIRIMFPLDGAQRGPDTAISYEISNFTLVPPDGPPNVPNEGHIEVLLDGSLYQELTEYEPAHFSDVPDGDHIATLRLVDNAHNPLSPDVSDSVHFHVTAGTILDISPGLAITNLGLAAAIIAALYYPVGKGKR